MKIITHIFFAVCTLMLTSCAATNEAKTNKPKMDRAEFTTYGIEVHATEAKNGKCIYGPHSLHDFTATPKNGYTGAGGYILLYIFKKLNCKWETMDGTPREETIDMGKLLLPRYVEWEHIAEEKLLEYEPMRPGSLNFIIRIKDKQFKITREYTVQFYGEQLSETSYKIKSQEMEEIIYDRNR